jgi:hypothetical protein
VQRVPARAGDPIAAIETPALVVELASPPLERRRQVRVAADEITERSPTQSELAEGEDPAELRQLGRGVVAVARARVDPGRREEALGVVRAQDLRRNAG